MGTIHKALKIRIYPTQKQQEILNKTLGSCRALYNMMLFERIQTYDNWKVSGKDAKFLYDYKYKTEKQYKKEYEWLIDSVDAVALQQSRLNLRLAYTNFFKSLKGKRTGSKVGFPKFKKKRNASSYRTMNNNNSTTIRIDFESQKVKLPKTGWLKFRDQRKEIKGIIKSATVSRTPTGKYFVSLLIEKELNLKPIEISNALKAKTIGLDMSLENFFVDSTGNSPAYERLYRKYEPRLKIMQRRMSKKRKGSNNWYKALYRVNLIHEKIANKRKDFTHKLSTELVKSNEVIVIENLSLKGMSQALKLGKSVMDLGYSEFVRQLQYKSLWNNKILIEADKWFASSKTCSFCGYVKKDLMLQERTWICPNCGKKHNRDENAGINLRNYGLEFLGLEQPDIKPVETSMHKVESIKQEILEFLVQV
ncbi:MAG: transposase [Candidatus Paceibacterota bacterium]|jgi:putative transposase